MSGMGMPGEGMPGTGMSGEVSEAEKRLKSCCFTGHRPEKLGCDEAEAVRLLDAAGRGHLGGRACIERAEETPRHLSHLCASTSRL